MKLFKGQVEYESLQKDIENIKFQKDSGERDIN
jgi:hypothetical protein